MAEIAHQTISLDRCRDKEKTRKKKSTNSHEAHGKKIPRTEALNFTKTSADRVIRLNKLFSDVKTGLEDHAENESKIKAESEQIANVQRK